MIGRPLLCCVTRPPDDLSMEPLLDLRPVISPGSALNDFGSRKSQDVFEAYSDGCRGGNPNVEEEPLTFG